MKKIVVFSALGIIWACNDNNSIVHGWEHSSKSVFNEDYYCNGDFIGGSQDSIETNLWTKIGLDSTCVMFGKYDNGLPVGDWKFLYKNDSLIKSNWIPVSDSMLAVRFSVPFSYSLLKIDSSYFNLTNNQAEFNYVNLIVGIKRGVHNVKDISTYCSITDSSLIEQGYSFHQTRINQTRVNGIYHLNVFDVTDKFEREGTVFHFYGMPTSQNYFLELVYFFGSTIKTSPVHMQIFDQIVNSFYVENRRFMNPYLK